MDRPASEREMLRTLGASIYVISLQGFVFFGTAITLLDRIRERLGTSEAPPLRFLLVDLRRVTGVDSSAVLAFSRVAELGRGQGFEVILTGADPSVRRQVEQGGVTDGDATVRFEEDVDHGLERCEDLLLEGARTGGDLVADAVDESTLGDLRERLDPYLERLEVSAGTLVIRQGIEPTTCSCSSRGVRVEMATSDGHRLRLRTMVREAWWARSRSTRERLGRPTSWPKPPARSCD